MSVAVRVLMLSWEYPPDVVGGLGRHVGALASELAAAGHDVRVVTRGDADRPTSVVDAGVRVIRAAADPLALDFTTESLLAWASALEHTLLRAGLAEVRDWRPDVVHAHDWLVAQSAITLAGVTGAPLVSTLHATEVGRHQGWLPQPLNRAIHSVERWLVSRSAAVIVCAQAMRTEVVGQLAAPAGRVHVVPNGIDPTRWTAGPDACAAARRQLAPDGPLLVVAARFVHEKGVQTVLDALHPLREQHPGLRLAVAGTGPYEPELRARATARRVARAVSWLGFLPDRELAAVLGAADALVVPSLYEPFGIVALEGAACSTPLVLADTGGLADLVARGLAAASFTPGDAGTLVDAIGKLLVDPDAARHVARRAAATVRAEYGWPVVAAATERIYAQAALRSATAPASDGRG